MTNNSSSGGDNSSSQGAFGADLEASYESPYQIMTAYGRNQILQGQSKTLPAMGSRNPLQQSELGRHDSGGDEDLDQYVRMDTIMAQVGGGGVDLRATADRVNKRVKNNKRENRTTSVICDDASDEYVEREDFIGLRLGQEALRRKAKDSGTQE